MSAKHTPGEWTYREGTTVVCTTQGVDIAIVERGDNQRANAVLISASPDMLQALKDAQRMLETASRYFPKSIKNSDRFSLLNVLENSVGKAIRKAEGAE